MGLWGLPLGEQELEREPERVEKGCLVGGLAWVVMSVSKAAWLGESRVVWLS